MWHSVNFKQQSFLNLSFAETKRHYRINLEHCKQSTYGTQNELDLRWIVAAFILYKETNDYLIN